MKEHFSRADIEGMMKQPEQIKLPNAVSVLALGIASCASIIIYFLLGIPGIICGIIALVRAKKDFATYKKNPGWYKAGSLKMLKAGKMLATIGFFISCFLFLAAIILIILASTGSFRNF